VSTKGIRVKTSTSTRAAAAVVGAATAAAVLIIGSTAASAEPHVDSSAYVLKTAGVLAISPSPYAQSVDGQADRQSVLDVTALPQLAGSGISLSALVAEAEGNTASADVAQVNVLELLKAKLVHTWCDGDSGGFDLVDGSLLGKRFDGPVPHQKIDVSPLISIEVNAQSHEDGALTVKGFVLSVLPAGNDPARALTDAEKQVAPDLLGLFGKPAAPAPLKSVGDLLTALNPNGDGLLTVTIGSATCTTGGGDDSTPAPTTTDEPAPTTTEDVPAEHREEAPAPEVVPFHLPVTG
jgi:hypothetical protein